MVQLRDAREPAEMPESMGPTRLAATRSGVFIGTRLGTDGPTTVIVDTNSEAQLSTADLAFEGLLETPSGRLAVLSGHDTLLEEIPVLGQRVRLRVWKNHPREPTEITIQLQEQD